MRNWTHKVVRVTPSPEGDYKHPAKRTFSDVGAAEAFAASYIKELEGTPSKVIVVARKGGAVSASFKTEQQRLNDRACISAAARGVHP